MNRCPQCSGLLESPGAACPRCGPAPASSIQATVPETLAASSTPDPEDWRTLPVGRRPPDKSGERLHVCSVILAIVGVLGICIALGNIFLDRSAYGWVVILVPSVLFLTLGVMGTLVATRRRAHEDLATDQLVRPIVFISCSVLLAIIAIPAFLIFVVIVCVQLNR